MTDNRAIYLVTLGFCSGRAVLLARMTWAWRREGELCYHAHRSGAVNSRPALATDR